MCIAVPSSLCQMQLHACFVTQNDHSFLYQRLRRLLPLPLSHIPPHPQAKAAHLVDCKALGFSLFLFVSNAHEHIARQDATCEPQRIVR